jgi:hypothetical protein
VKSALAYEEVPPIIKNFETPDEAYTIQNNEYQKKI